MALTGRELQQGNEDEDDDQDQKEQKQKSRSRDATQGDTRTIWRTKQRLQKQQKDRYHAVATAPSNERRRGCWHGLHKGNQANSARLSC